MSYNSKVETFRIKGMCCSRCVRALKEELSKLSLTKITVRIGEAELVYGKEIIPFEQTQNAVEDAGFEIMTLLQNKKIEEVKEYVRRHLSDSNALRLSVLSRAVAVSPYHLSRTFSLIEKETLQDFIIRTRVEYAAQLLRDTERAFDGSGHIYACTATVGKNGEELGTFYPTVNKANDLIKVWEERDVTTIPECKGCNLQLACGGGCASIAKNRTGNLASPDCRPITQLLEMGISHYFSEQ